MPQSQHRIDTFRALLRPDSGATAAEREVARRLLDAAELQQAKAVGSLVPTYFCGDGRGALSRDGGHYCYVPGGRTDARSEPSPWHGTFEPVSDSAVIAEMRQGVRDWARDDEVEGAWFHRQRDGWTLVCCWDRSGDLRHGSVAAFAMKGLYERADAVAHARGLFPTVFERIDLHLGHTTDGEVLRARVVLALAEAPQSTWGEIARLLRVEVP